jgi:hypothetical protein
MDQESRCSCCACERVFVRVCACVHMLYCTLCAPTPTNSLVCFGREKPMQIVQPISCPDRPSPTENTAGLESLAHSGILLGAMGVQITCNLQTCWGEGSRAMEKVYCLAGFGTEAIHDLVLLRWGSQALGPPTPPSPFSLWPYKDRLSFPSCPARLGTALPFSLPFCTADYAQITYGSHSRVTPNFSKTSSGTQLMSVVAHVGWADTISDSRGASALPHEADTMERGTLPRE